MCLIRSLTLRLISTGVIFQLELRSRKRLTLSGHLKTGHTWSGQNLPTESPPGLEVFTLLTASCPIDFGLAFPKAVVFFFKTISGNRVVGTVENSGRVFLPSFPSAVSPEVPKRAHLPKAGKLLEECIRYPESSLLPSAFQYHPHTILRSERHHRL